VVHALTRTARRLAGERGASAVEFALVAPLLIALLFGMASTARAFQIQAGVSGAAREAARTLAITNDVGQARSVAVDAAANQSVQLGSGSVSITPTTCSGQPAGTNVRVTIVYRYQPFGPFNDGLALDITSKAVIRCGA
jgi:Flp pilus assembly protein TadG